MSLDDLDFIPGSARVASDLLESAGSVPFATVRDLLSTCRGQDDVSFNKLSQIRQICLCDADS